MVVAASDDVIAVEGNLYFPTDSVDTSMLEPSRRHSWCWWKGRATYYDVVVDGIRSPASAFAYERPWPLARRLVGDRIAFWQGVAVLD